MASPARFAFFCLALLAAAAARADFYCCPDPASGRRTCGDTLPDACRGRAYKIFDNGGNLRREVGPPPTAEQKAAAAAEVQRRKEEEAAQREQRRKDQALLETYTSVQDIELARSRNERDLQEAIKQTEDKLASLQQRRKKLESEAEFYKNKPLPPEIGKGLKDNEAETRSYADQLEGKKTDFAQVRAKYDQDKRRYLQLTGGKP